jgi:hypothetical protein
LGWMELTLVLAVLLRDWTMKLIPGQNIRLKPAIPLGSNHPIRVMVHQLTAFVAVLSPQS